MGTYLCSLRTGSDGPHGRHDGDEGRTAGASPRRRLLRYRQLHAREVGRDRWPRHGRPTPRAVPIRDAGWAAAPERPRPWPRAPIAWPAGHAVPSSRAPSRADIARRDAAAEPLVHGEFFGPARTSISWSGSRLPARGDAQAVRRARVFRTRRPPRRGWHLSHLAPGVLRPEEWPGTSRLAAAFVPAGRRRRITIFKSGGAASRTHAAAGVRAPLREGHRSGRRHHGASTGWALSRLGTR